MPLADRRVAARFEIVGELWGSMQALQRLHICNLAPEGALVESLVPLPVGSVQPLRLVRGAQYVDLRAAVRHTSPVEYESGIKRYRVGIEFLSVNEEAAECIGSLMDEYRRDGSKGEA
jgi:hypothetical protein